MKRPLLVIVPASLVALVAFILSPYSPFTSSQPALTPAQAAPLPRPAPPESIQAVLPAPALPKASPDAASGTGAAQSMTRDLEAAVPLAPGDAPPVTPPASPPPTSASASASVTVALAPSSLTLSGVVPSEVYRRAVERSLLLPGLTLDNQLQVDSRIPAPPWDQALLDTLPLLLRGATEARFVLDSSQCVIQREVEDAATADRLRQRLAALLPPGAKLVDQLSLAPRPPVTLIVSRAGNQLTLEGTVDRTLRASLLRVLHAFPEPGLDIRDQTETGANLAPAPWIRDLADFLPLLLKDVADAQLRIEADQWTIRREVDEVALRTRLLDEISRMLPEGAALSDEIKIHTRAPATLSLVFEPPLVILQGFAASHQQRTAWVDAAQLRASLRVVNQVEIDPTLDEPVWNRETRRIFDLVLGQPFPTELHLEAGGARFLPALPQPEDTSSLALLLEAALPHGYPLHTELRPAASAAPPPFQLVIELDPTRIGLAGTAPSREFRDALLQPLLEVERFTSLEDTLVLDESQPAPPWITRIPAFTEAVAPLTQSARLEFGPNHLAMRGLTPDLASRLRLTKLALSHFPSGLAIENHFAIGTQPPSLVPPRLSAPLLASADSTPPPASPPMVMTEPAPPASPPVVAAAAPPTPAPAPAPEPVPPLPTREKVPARFDLHRSPDVLALSGLLPDDASRDRVLQQAADAFPGLTIENALEIDNGVESAPWVRELGALLDPVARLLTTGDLEIRDGHAHVKGQLASVSDRDALIAALAQTLPSHFKIQDDSKAAPSADGGVRHSIFFNTGSTYIGLKHRRDLTGAAAEWKQRGPDASILIKGFADPRGDSELNQILSRQRAQAVHDLLVAEGVPASRIQIVGVGAQTNGEDDTGLALQHERRVDLAIVD